MSVYAQQRQRQLTSATRVEWTRVQWSKPGGCVERSQVSSASAIQSSSSSRAEQSNQLAIAIVVVVAHTQSESSVSTQANRSFTVCFGSCLARPRIIHSARKLANKHQQNTLPASLQPRQINAYTQPVAGLPACPNNKNKPKSRRRRRRRKSSSQVRHPKRTLMQTLNSNTYKSDEQ